MTALASSTDIAAGWLLFAVSLLVLGGVIVAIGWSAWSESRARKAERIIVGPVVITQEAPDLVNTVTVSGKDWRPDVDRDMRQAVYVTTFLDKVEAKREAERLLASNVVPLQRRAVD